MPDGHGVMITVEEYEELKRDQRWLHYLEQAGVDNWDGCSYAHELRREAEGDEDDD